MRASSSSSSASSSSSSPLAVIALFGATVYALRTMLLYLQSSLSLQLPTTQSLLHVVFDFADRNPLLALSINFAIATIIGWAFLYNKELSAWIEEWQMRRGAAITAPGGSSASKTTTDGYTKLNEAKPEPAQGRAAAQMAAQAAAMESAAQAADEEMGGEPAQQQSLLDQRRQMTTELRLVCDKLEELEIKTRVLHKKVSTPAAIEARAELKELQARRSELSQQLHGEAPKEEEEADTAAVTTVSTLPRDAPLVIRVLKSALVQVLMRSANGIISVGLYFADIISDVQGTPSRA